jgi:glycerol uptake facilitator protein
VETSLGVVLLSEILGTAALTLLGCGVVANVLLRDAKGRGADWLLISFGWAMAVFVGVYVAYRSGAHLNPAVTLGLLASGSEEYAPGVDVTFAATIVYFIAQFLGAFLGAVLVWLTYRQHFDRHDVPGEKLAVFSTGPQIRNPLWNTVTEVIATFVLVYTILQLGNTPTAIGPVAVAFLVLAIGMSLGGPTGYAINPARDLGPRIAHAVLPIRGKGGNDWGYSWVPVVGPIAGGVLAGLVSLAVTELT